MFTFHSHEGSLPKVPRAGGMEPRGKSANVCNQDNVETHFARGAIRKVASGRVLWNEGDECEYIYLVRNGCLRFSQVLPDGRRAVHDFAFKGDVVGMSSITHDRDAEAVEPTSLYSLSLPQFRKSMSDDPAFSGAISALVRRSLRTAHEHVTVLSRLAAGERIAHFLIELYEQAQRMGTEPLQVSIPMRRADIADYIGVTVETVCRTLAAFRDAGLVTMVKVDELRITDIKHLRALATGESDPDDKMRWAS